MRNKETFVRKGTMQVYEKSRFVVTVHKARGNHLFTAGMALEAELSGDECGPRQARGHHGPPHNAQKLQFPKNPA